MHIIIQSSILSLEKSVKLLNVLTDDILTNTSVSPYYSSIGSHLRHIYDIYDCIINGLDYKYVDLTQRTRDLQIESCTEIALKKVNDLIEKLKLLSSLGRKIIVNDDLGLGHVKVEYTLGSILAQANSHAIHHYAIINYILDRLEVSFDDEDFGFNPTTPKLKTNLN